MGPQQGFLWHLLCARVGQDFSVVKAPSQGGHFRARDGGAEAAWAWEEVGVPRGKRETSSL